MNDYLRKMYKDLGGDGYYPIYWEEGIWLLPDGSTIHVEDDGYLDSPILDDEDFIDIF